MCEQCTAQTLMWHNHVVPGFWLVKAQKDGWYMKKDWYGLVECNDPTFVFSIEPEKDPTSGLTDEEMDAIPEFMDKQFHPWEDKVREFAFQLTFDPRAYETGKKSDGTPWVPDPKETRTGIETSYRLVVACSKAGWRKEKHGSVEFWLFHRIACHLEKETLIEDVGYTNKEKEKNPIALEGSPD